MKKNITKLNTSILPHRSGFLKSFSDFNVFLETKRSKVVYKFVDNTLHIFYSLLYNDNRTTNYFTIHKDEFSSIKSFSKAEKILILLKNGQSIEINGLVREERREEFVMLFMTYFSGSKNNWTLSI